MFSRVRATGILFIIGLGVLAGQAQTATDKPLSQNPDAVKEYNKALEVGNKGDTKTAEAGYRKAIKLDPNFALAHNNLGSMLMDRGDIAGAETSYQAAIQADPKLQLARLNLGSVQVDQKKFDEAVQTLDQLIAMIGVPAANVAPESASLGALLGGKTPTDAADVTAPLNDTQKAKAFYLRGLAQAGLGHHPDAVLDYR
ncbi:MAG: tetratricopeptide repeat protein, partial [Pyrinomonadaceae bacterium]